jgi:MoaA/NifB/PqqE/SkfB family radical SAM enzyme
MKAEISTRKSEKRTDLSTVTPLATPYVIFIDPSSACNFRCTFCPTGDLPLMKQIGRYQGALKLGDFEKLITDLDAFPDQIKVLRLYKDGEPLVNKHFAKMISLARSSKKIELIDTTTNGALLTPATSEAIIGAGIDLINISIDGLDSGQLMEFAKVELDYPAFIDNIRYLHSIKGNCKIVIKTTTEIIGASRKQEFFDTFGNYCDKIFVENTSPCWPDFDVEARMGIEITQGLYGNAIVEQTACPYIFYSMSVNSDMNVSACFVDWSRGLIIGDARRHSLLDIWNSDEMNSHRLAHLDGLRKSHGICGSCGQISHCGPDSIEDTRDVMKQRFVGAGMFQGLDDTVTRMGYSATKAAAALRNIAIKPI